MNSKQMEYYRTLDGESIRIDSLPEQERNIYQSVLQYFRQNPSHIEFENWWQRECRPILRQHPWDQYPKLDLVRISTDLADRLAITQGELEPDTPEAALYLVEFKDQSAQQKQYSPSPIVPGTIPTASEFLDLINQSGHTFHITKKKTG